jgi:predicted MFS family arabinose efflux permease
VGKALASDLAPKHPRALGVGLYSSVVGAARLVASLVGGQLWQTTGPTATFVYAAGLAASGAIVLAARVPNRSAPSSGRHLV